MQVPYFEAPGPRGEIPTFEAMKPWLASDFHSRADGAEDTAQSVPAYYSTWEAQGRESVLREVANLIEATPDAKRLSVLKEAHVAFALAYNQVVPVCLTDSAQRNNKSVHTANGAARAWAEVDDRLAEALDVLSGRPGAKIVLHARHLPNGRYEPEEANPP